MVNFCDMCLESTWRNRHILEQQLRNHFKPPMVAMFKFPWLPDQTLWEKVLFFSSFYFPLRELVRVDTMGSIFSVLRELTFGSSCSRSNEHLAQP